MELNNNQFNELVSMATISYTSEELSKKIKAPVNLINVWRQEGLLKGIKAGKHYIYSSLGIFQFLQKYEGLDISNRLKARKAKALHG